MPLNQPLWVKRFKEQQPVRDQVTITGRQQPQVNAMLPRAGGVMGNPIDSTYSTGAGPDGVVQPNRSVGQDKIEYHEGEEVVGNKTVNNLGGNKAVRDIIDKELIRKGMEKSNPGNGVPMGKGGGQVFGYEDAGAVGVGTGGSYVDMLKRGSEKAQNTPSPAPTDTADTADTTDTTAPAPEAPTPPPDVTPQITGEAPTAAPPPIDQGAVGGMQQEMLQETRDVAMGKSKLMESLANQGFQNLDARQQTQLSQTAMQISSDPNLTEGQKRSMMASTMRDHGIQQSELAGDLAIASMKEARQAQGQVFDMTSRIQDFEQKRFEKTRDFNERKRQWQDNQDYKKNVDAINAAIDAGDYENAEKFAKLAWEDAGIEVSFDKLESREAQKTLNTGLLNISTNIAAGMSMDNEVMQQDLKSTWESMHPDVPYNAAEGTDSGDWAKNTIDQMKRNSDPIAADIYALDSDTLAATVRPAEAGADWSLDEFTYKNLTGRKAAEAVMIDLKMNKGYTFDADGNMTVDWDNPIWAATGVTKPADDVPTDVKTGYEKYGFTKEEFEAAESYSGGVFYKDGEAYVKTGDESDDIVTLEDYEKNPDFTNDPVFSDEAGTPKESGSRVMVGDTDYKKSKRTGKWEKVSALSFDAELGDAWGGSANEIMKLGEDYDQELYNSVIDARADSIITEGNTDKLKTLDPEDPVYQKVSERQDPYESPGYFETSGNNQQNFSQAPPSKGELVKLNGRLYVVDSTIGVNKQTGGGREYQYFTVKTPDGKKTYTVKPGGLGSHEYDSNTLHPQEDLLAREGGSDSSDNVKKKDIDYVRGRS